MMKNFYAFVGDLPPICALAAPGQVVCNFIDTVSFLRYASLCRTNTNCTFIISKEPGSLA
jgi:hypothetical protein